MPGTSPTHREPGAWRYGTQLQKKYIFIRKALCRGARLCRTELIPPTPLDGTREPKGRPALAISSAFLLARSNPRGRGEGGISRNQLDPTPGMARLWWDRQWRAVPGAQGAGAWGLLPVTDSGHVPGDALGAEHQHPPSPVHHEPNRPEWGVGSERLRYCRIYRGYV